MPVHESDKKIGLIAGGGQFPRLFCRAARKSGYRVVVVALEGEAEKDLAQEADECHWIYVGQAGRVISTFQKAGVTEACLLGSVKKASLFNGTLRPDWKMLTLIPRLAKYRNHHDDSLLRAAAEWLAEDGIIIRESTLFLPELLVPAGVLGRRRPSQEVMVDGRFGFEMAKELGQLDIGQCVVVREKTVLAVEAIEGTDACIRRGGEFGRGRAVVVKVCKPKQDLRFDLPAVGCRTIEVMIEAKCQALFLEAGRSLCFDREEMLRLADEHGIAVTGLSPEPAPGTDTA